MVDQYQHDIQAAWREHAPKLAAWALALANRTDVWGQYLPWRERGTKYVRPDGSEGVRGSAETWPYRSRRGVDLLSLDLLLRHFRGERPEHILGLHAGGADGLSRWGALDIDKHDDNDQADPDLNRRVAVGLHGELANLGLNPLLTGSNGAGGYHLRLLFSRPVPTADMFTFLQAVAARAVELGLPAPPETFPKQAALDRGQYGNWLRLPGRHHSRQRWGYWSEVYNCGRWLAGDWAVQALVEHNPSDPELLPVVQAPAPPPAPQPTAPRRRPLVLQAGAVGGAAAVARRIEAYIDKLPCGLSAGNGRDDVAFRLAAWLVKDVAVNDEVALVALEEWDRRNTVPKGRPRLQLILRNAHTYGGRG